MRTETNIVWIDCKEIVLLHFPKEDVLFSKDEREQRLNEVLEMMNDEALTDRMFRIVFQDIEGLKMVDTKIWALTEKEVILKKGVTIPLQRILKIDNEKR